eukprot:757291-Hanusia_phi.AAC.9
MGEKVKQSRDHRCWQVRQPARCLQRCCITTTELPIGGKVHLFEIDAMSDSLTAMSLDAASD